MVASVANRSVRRIANRSSLAACARGRGVPLEPEEHAEAHRAAGGDVRLGGARRNAAFPLAHGASASRVLDDRSHGARCASARSRPSRIRRSTASRCTRDLGRQISCRHTLAAVELLRTLRPTVARCGIIVFIVHTLSAQFPETERSVIESDGAIADAFITRGAAVLSFFPQCL